MVRKTKEDAEATRASILDAAERLFYSQGVSRTSLQDIASAAGVTRGAIYWHFKDKSDVFIAMMDRVVLPMEVAEAQLSVDDDRPVLARLRQRAQDLFATAMGCESLRRIMDISMHKVEYVDELDAVRLRRIQMRSTFRQPAEQLLRRGQQRGEVVAAVPAAQLAVGLQLVIEGVLTNWLLDPEGFDLPKIGLAVVDVHLAGMAAPPRAAPRGKATPA